MLKIQEFINCFDDINEANKYLKQNLNIESVLHMDEQVILYRAGLHADMSNPIVRETHCLVLDVEGDVMGKAWNYPHVVNSYKELPPGFNFISSVIAEDLPDGEIIVVYNIEGKWIIGTRDHASGKKYFPGMDLPGFTFEHEVKAMLAKRFNSWDKPFENVNPMICFIFSYVNPYLKCVMPVISPQLFLMAVINLENGEELSHTAVQGQAIKMGFELPKWSEINGVTSLNFRLDSLRALCPGIMLRDKAGQRVVITNPIHEAIKDALEAGNRVCPTHMANILNACRDKADVTAIRATYRDYGPMLELLWNCRIELWQELLTLWKTAETIENLKEFAVTIQYHPLNYILFKFRDKLISNIKDEVEIIKPRKLVTLTKERWEREFAAASEQLKYAGGS